MTRKKKQGLDVAMGSVGGSNKAVRPDPPAKRTRTLAGPLDPAKMHRVALAVRHGMPAEAAFGLVGVTRRDGLGWLARGEAEAERIQGGAPANPEELPYLVLWQDVSGVRAELHETLSSRVVEASRYDYRAGLEVLKLRFPEFWSDRLKQETATQLELVLDVVKGEVSASIYERILAKLSAIGSGEGMSEETRGLESVAGSVAKTLA